MIPLARCETKPREMGVRTRHLADFVAGACPYIVSALARLVTPLRVRVDVEGLENVPLRGPVLIAAHHFHHAWDGFVLLASLPRPLSIVIALDWIPLRPLRVLMESVAAVAGWPVVIRPDGPARLGRGAYRLEEAPRYLRVAARSVIRSLRAGKAVVIFPEAYPNVDPVFTVKRPESRFLPFRSGFVKLAAYAHRGQAPIPIVPTGLSYQTGRRWHVTVRFGEPIYLLSGLDMGDVARAVEEQVHVLSRSSTTTAALATREAGAGSA